MLNLLIRQPFTETTERERTILQQVMDLVTALQPEFAINFLSPAVAQDAASFKDNYEQTSHESFTPEHFRQFRFSLLDKADAFLLIRTSMSESSAIEVAYNIFAGKNVPMFFAIDKEIGIKTTLLRELENAEYHHFTDPQELVAPLRSFFTKVAQRIKAGKEHQVLTNLVEE